MPLRSRCVRASVSRCRSLSWSTGLRNVTFYLPGLLRYPDDTGKLQLGSVVSGGSRLERRLEDMGYDEAKGKNLGGGPAARTELGERTYPRGAGVAN